MGNRIAVMFGERRNSLVYISEASDYISPRSERKRKIVCRCDCGATVESLFSSFLNGRRKSCGCVRQQKLLSRNTDHGLAKHPAYPRWKTMIDRCNNPNSTYFKNYGGRGITVCDRWKSVAAFIKDMGIPPTGSELDRIDNESGYSPENCKWRSREENSQNKRTSRYWFVNAVRYDSLRQASESLETPMSTVRNWCLGQVTKGCRYPPRANCWSLAKY